MSKELIEKFENDIKKEVDSIGFYLSLTRYVMLYFGILRKMKQLVHT